MRDCDPVIALVEAWMPVLPQWIVENVQDQLIMPRLLQEVDCWNPLTDMVPIHAWLHPWLPIMGKVTPIYTCRTDFSSYSMHIFVHQTCESSYLSSRS